MSPLRIALATYDRAPGLADDDRLLIPALSALGVDAEVAVWSDPTVRWNAYDAVVVRSCWDYHLHIDDFGRWIDRLSQDGVRLWNPPDVIRWNSHKSYLAALGDRGVPIIPTVRIKSGNVVHLLTEVAEREWSRIVVKPCVSASGYETHMFDVPLEQGEREELARILSIGDVLVQPFAEEIPRDGEVSMVFIGGSFSHAVLKRAREDEFRVQAEHGGTVARLTATASLVAQAHRALAAAPSGSLYARVDGVVRNGELLLMELELIEPNLYLGMYPNAAVRLAAAIVQRL